MVSFCERAPADEEEWAELAVLLASLACVSPVILLLSSVVRDTDTKWCACLLAARSIYDYAEYNGVHLPASCKQGSCSACVAKVLQGWSNSSNGALRSEHPRAHKTCPLGQKLT